jgi:hypothetical protein
MAAHSYVKEVTIPYTETPATEKRRPFPVTLTLRRTFAEKYVKTSAFRKSNEAFTKV